MDKSEVKKPKAKKPKAIGSKKPKVKAKPKPKPTQTQTQKVILNLSDVLKKKPSRRSPAKPRQPQIVYQQAPQPLQPDISSIIKEQLSGIKEKEAEMPKPVLMRSDNVQPVEQPKQNLVQAQQPIISITEPVKTLKPNPLLSMFKMTPTTDRPIQLEEPDVEEQVMAKPKQIEAAKSGEGSMEPKPTTGKGSRGPRSEQTKAKISASKTGKSRTEETKTKISASKTGKSRTEEERESISQGLTAYHAGKNPFVK